MVVPATEAEIERAAEHLRAGRLVAFPTETVYGLGADATNGIAVAAIYEAKGRPRFNPLIVHVADPADAAAVAKITGSLAILADAFWPGPLTLVAPRAPGCTIAEIATAGLDTVAVRCPDHRIARALIRATARPIVAPSANRSGHVSATTAAHVAADLGDRVAVILDGGGTAIGVESTIVTADACGSLVVLREGGLTREAIFSRTGLCVGEAIIEADQRRPVSPGRLESHYAPGARVLLEQAGRGDADAYLAFGPYPEDGDDRVRNLSATGDLAEAAVNLFTFLRELDTASVGSIAVAPIPDIGIGRAINDRLRRAAAPRDPGPDR